MQAGMMRKYVRNMVWEKQLRYLHSDPQAAGKKSMRDSWHDGDFWSLNAQPKQYTLSLKTKAPNSSQQSSNWGDILIQNTTEDNTQVSALSYNGT